MSDSSEIAVVFVGVGSNIEPEKNIVTALELLTAMATVMRSSTFYRTRALGRPQEPDFVNGVWQIETTVSPIQVKSEMLGKIEERLERERTGDKFASRTIDLDLILYNDMVTESDELVLPHPDLERPFVYVPTLELLEQMSDGTRGPLAAKMKVLVPSGTSSVKPGEPLERFTSRLRELLRQSVK